jgi:transposase-like protein
MGRRLDDIELAALMIDGIDLEERCNVVALGITRDGTKLPLGLWQGSTENVKADLAARLVLVHKVTVSNVAPEYLGGAR